MRQLDMKAAAWERWSSWRQRLWMTAAHLVELYDLEPDEELAGRNNGWPANPQGRAGIAGSWSGCSGGTLRQGRCCDFDHNAWRLAHGRRTGR